jgi:hypothetical protein
MIRALTIRFGLLYLGLVPLIGFLNRVEPAPGLVGLAMILYVCGGGLIIGLYCVAHEDEIPLRRPRSRDRR